ncbi:MAG: metallophosphoesterase family protein [Coprobacillus sp.]
MKYKIGIISDTHDVLKEEVIDNLKDCDYILHAGDVMKEEILLRLKAICKVIVVEGNNDNLGLNKEEYFDIGGYHFYMSHQLGEHQNVDFYVFGHSHQYAHYLKDSTVYLNPGGCGRRRFSMELSYIILYLDNKGYKIEKRKIE